MRTREARGAVLHRTALFHVGSGQGAAAADDLAEVLSGGPTPFSISRAGPGVSASGSTADSGPGVVVVAVPNVAAAQAWSAGPDVAGKPDLLVLAIDAAAGDDPRAAADRVAEAVAAANPRALTVVACGQTPAVLDLLAQTLSGGPGVRAEVRVGDLRDTLSAARAGGAAVAVQGGADDALVLRRVTPPPRTVANPHALAGTRLVDRYDVLERIGAGGMGVVYRARQIGMDRDVAIKVSTAALVGGERGLARFRREARLLSRLRHPNLVAVHDFGVSDDGVAFIAMELLQGQVLSDLSPRGEPLPVARCLALTDQVCAALEAAHQQGVIHRDLKPENLLVERLPDGREHVRVLDFGLARGDEAGSLATTQGGVMGTPAYMAPEQIRGRDQDERTDLYQLGAVMYHLLTGQRPFTGPTVDSVMMQHLSAEAPDLRSLRPEIPPAVARLVAELMRKAPHERPATAREVRARLAALRSPEPEPSVVKAASEALSEIAGDPLVGARSRAAWWLAGAMVAALLATGGWWLSRPDARHERSAVEVPVNIAPAGAAPGSAASQPSMPSSGSAASQPSMPSSGPPAAEPTAESTAASSRPTSAGSSAPAPARAASPAPRSVPRPAELREQPSNPPDPGRDVDLAIERELRGMTR